MLKLIVRGVFKQRQMFKFVRRILKKKQMLKFVRRGLKENQMLTRIKETKLFGIAQDLKKGTSNLAVIKQESLSQKLTQFVTKYLL